MNFNDCFRDNAIECPRGGREARLAPTFLLHNEMGVFTGVRELVSAERPAKVVFDLPAGKARGALALWYVDRLVEPSGCQGPEGLPMPRDYNTTILVNGHRIEHCFAPEAMLTGGWDRRGIPPKFLLAGRNEIVFSGQGRLRIEPGEGRASFKSFDGGQTWHANALGPKNDLAGEYMVRLRVKGHPARGVITSPVTDLADPLDEGRIAPLLALRQVALKARSRRPKGTGIRFEMRSGASPSFDATCWTAWRETTALKAPGRFVQWRATLTTARLDATPVLTDVALDAGLRAAARTSREIMFWDRPQLRRSSYDFTHLAPHPRATRLVKQWRLDEVIEPGRTDLERLMLLRNWCHKQWVGWWKQRYPFCATWDPLDILDTVKNNWGYGMCTHWAALFVGCAAALGYVARASVIDHHCLPEVWSEELDKWVIMDPANEDGNAVLEMDGALLNNLDVRQAVAQGRGGDIRRRVWRPWWSKHAAGESVSEAPLGDREHVLPFPEASWPVWNRLGIALRNNHLVQAEPAEDQHGDRHYHWNGYLWWSDESDPKYPEHSLLTTREADLYWTVGKTRIHLALTRDARRLEARFEHTMPNFERYEAKLDDGEWIAVPSRLDWALHGTENRISVRAVNSFGKAGPATSVVVKA